MNRKYQRADVEYLTSSFHECCNILNHMNNNMMNIQDSHEKNVNITKDKIRSKLLFLTYKWRNWSLYRTTLRKESITKLDLYKPQTPKPLKFPEITLLPLCFGTIFAMGLFHYKVGQVGNSLKILRFCMQIILTKVYG